jgi:hypothetical protein
MGNQQPCNERASNPQLLVSEATMSKCVNYFVGCVRQCGQQRFLDVIGLTVVLQHLAGAVMLTALLICARLTQVTPWHTAFLDRWRGDQNLSPLSGNLDFNHGYPRRSPIEPLLGWTFAIYISIIHFSFSFLILTYYLILINLKALSRKFLIQIR